MCIATMSLWILITIIIISTTKCYLYLWDEQMYMINWLAWILWEMIKYSIILLTITITKLHVYYNMCIVEKVYIFYIIYDYNCLLY